MNVGEVVEALRFSYVRIQEVQGTLNMDQLLPGYMQISLGCLDVKVSQEFLDVFDVYPLFQQMNSIALPKCMKC